MARLLIHNGIGSAIVDWPDYNLSTGHILPTFMMNHLHYVENLDTLTIHKNSLGYVLIPKLRDAPPVTPIFSGRKGEVGFLLAFVSDVPYYHVGLPVHLWEKSYKLAADPTDETKVVLRKTRTRGGIEYNVWIERYDNGNTKIYSTNTEEEAWQITKQLI